MKPIKLKTYTCNFCGCKYHYVGDAPYTRYCSDECKRLAMLSKTKKHRLKTLGTTDFSGSRIKDFKKESKRIKKEKKILHLI